MARPFLRGSVKIARIFGIPVYIHFTLLILLYALAKDGTGDAISGVSFVVLMFGCILAHEFGHALMARRFGIKTLDITLLPVGGVARLERMPEKPREEIMVALAGPAVNVVIAVGLFVFLYSTGRFEAELHPKSEDDVSLAMQMLKSNVLLLFFNMLPAFPMDGGRVLRAVLALKLPYVRATQIAAQVGQGMALLFAFAAVYSHKIAAHFGVQMDNPFILLLIAVVVWTGARQEAAMVEKNAAKAAGADDVVVDAAVRPEPKYIFPPLR